LVIKSIKYTLFYVDLQCFLRNFILNHC